MRAPLVALAVLVTLASCHAKSRPSTLDEAPSPSGVGSTGGMDGSIAEGGLRGQPLVDQIPTPHGLAVSDTDVYFTSGTGSGDGGPGATISSIPKIGGAVTALVSGPALPTELLRVNGILVWIDLGSSAQAGAVFKFDPATSVASQISGPLDRPSAIASDGTFVYIASYFPSGGLSIDRVSLAGGAPFSVTTVVGELSPAGMVVDAQNAYFVGLAQAGGALYRVALTGGPSEVLWSTNGGTLGDVAVTAGHVYWTLDAPTAGSATIFSLPTNGGATVSFATQQTHAVRLAFDAADLFWTTGSGGEVLRAPLSGGAPTVVASGLPSAVHLAATDAVYVTTSAGIVTIPK